MTTLAALGEYLFENVENTEKLWIDIFGTDFFKNLNNPHLALCKITTHTKTYLNRKPSRKGEATLFIRDPLSDRLKLLCSTNNELNPNTSVRPNEKYFSKIEEHFDTTQHSCFYTLCDRLTPDNDKHSEDSRRKRGLTGWVAVTGHYLRVNSERSQTRLDDIVKDNPETKSACTKYGTPLWGNHIAEFPRDDSPTWSKRFLAVPIKSISDPNTTIGVLRYTTIPEGSVLTEIDTIFLKSMAEIASVVFNLEKIRIKSIRPYQQELSKKYLNEAFDVYNYLEHLAKTLDSSISSLYIPLNIKGKNTLRLFDAFGVSGLIGELRDHNKIADYNSETLGLTYKLFTDKSNNPKIYNTVLEDSDNWRGLNTAIFYGSLLKNHGIQDIKQKLEDVYEKRKILDTYSIKLIGNRICYKNRSVGVVKVEFPSSFDSDKHYQNEDKDYFTNSIDSLSEILANFISLIEGDLLAGDKLDPIDFAKMYYQIQKVKLIDQDEAPQFYEKSENYIIRNKCKLQDANDLIVEKILKEEERNIFIRIYSKIPEYIKKELFSQGLQYLLKSIN